MSRPSSRRSTRANLWKAVQHLCEPLEQRCLLSTINWTNRVVSDNFASLVGGTAAQGRAIVDRAIDDWEQVINNFNYVGGGNTFSLNLSISNLGAGTRGSTSVSYNAQNRPTSATITLDDDGGGSGWYIDTVPGTAAVPDDGEFTTLNNPFQANAAVAGFDLYRTAAHEIGHAMGLASSSALLQAIDIDIGDDPNDGASARLFTIDVDGNAGADYCYTNAGGFHLYEGPSVGGNPIHPNELMNSGRTGVTGRRQLISDTIASLLRDSYGYTVTLPSFINTFYANLNTTTNVVTVTGDANYNNDNTDVIDLEVDGGTATSFEVNGTDEVIDGAQYTTIVVNAGIDADDIDVDELLSGKSVTVNGDAGNDNISAAQELQDIDTNLDSNFTANGGADTDTLVFNDQADSPGADDYTLTTTTFVKNASVINRVITYGTFETLTLNGGPNPGTYDINSLSSAVTNGLTITAGAANDIITLGGTVGDIDSFVNADVIMNGGGGSDTLHINDITDTLNDSYTLTSTTFSKSSTTESYTFSAVEIILLDAGLGDNPVDINSIGNNVSVTATGGDGDDTFNVGNGDMDTLFLGGTLTIDGQAGADTVVFDDLIDGPSADSYTIAATTLDKPNFAAPISYSNFETQRLEASPNADTIVMNSSFPSWRINGNAGIDTITVFGNQVGSSVTVDSGSNGDTVNVNTDNAGSASITFPSSQTLAALNLGGGASSIAIVAAGGGKLLFTNTLTTTATSKLDLNDNDMILNYAGATQLPTIVNLIRTARNGGAWNGFGITSSTAATDPNHDTGLGAIEATDYDSVYGAGALFNGVDPDGTSVLVKYTYYGDTNFNGKVDGADYAKMDAKFNQQVGSGNISGWFNGDLDYNGKIDGADYSLIDAAFNSQGAALRPSGFGIGTKPGAPRIS